MKRTWLIIVGIALALITLGVAVYLFAFRSTPEQPAADSGNPFDGAGAGSGEVRETPIPDLGVPMTGAGEAVTPQLYRITAEPVAHGAVAFPVRVPYESNGTTTMKDDTEVRYIDRASGNMYRFLLGARTLERITNLTLPGIQEAVWASDGSRAFLRFVSSEFGSDRIETYALSGTDEEGYFLEPGLSDVIVNGTSSILSVLPATNGTIGTRATLSGANPSTSFSTQLSALKVFRAGSSYAAATKPSALLPGYAFSIGRLGEFTRVLGPLSGLSILPSPSGAKYLYSYRDGGALRLALVDTTTNETTALPLSTLADKCAWSSDSLHVYCGVPRSISGTFPDDWYQGVEQTSDRIWRIDISTRLASLESDPSVLAGEDIDLVAPSLDSKDEVLVFTNRDDGSLWLYDI